MAKYYWSDHPSIEVDSGFPRLKVLRYLKPDMTLPKYLVDGMVVLKNRKPMTIEQYINSADGMSIYRRSGSMSRGNNPKGLFGHIRNLWESCSNWLSKKRNQQIPPETFKKACEMIDQHVIKNDIDKTAVKLKAIIDKTMENGQTALARRLQYEHKNILNEEVLVKNGLFHYLTEEDVVNLLKTADFGIRIDFWNDYAEIVPDEVLEAKKQADALRVFDNWCIMHYDPKGTTLKQMKTEEWARDPILFGMIVGSDRLYYVKDWKTSKDDLTIQKVCDLLNIKNIREAREYGASSEFHTVIEAMDGEVLGSSSDENSGDEMTNPLMDEPVEPEF